MRRLLRTFGFCACAVLITAAPSYCQFDPVGAQTDLYFPHLADGGPSAGKWQTAITFLNPNTLAAASVTIYLYGNDGSPLAIDFGNGAKSNFLISVPSLGTVTIRSAATAGTTSVGWAEALSTLPLQGTVQFRQIVNGVALQEVSALATPLAVSYLSPANNYTGIALANVYPFPLSLTIGLTDGGGKPVSSTSVSVPATGHASFSISSLFPSLSKSFTGSVQIAPVTPNTYFAGWTLSVDSSGVFSSYPPGSEAWPLNQVDSIRNAYFKDLSGAQYVSDQLGLGLTFNFQTVPLNISNDQILNAFATKADNSINIEDALAELISDSPSELAFVVAHEIGHTIQFKTNKLLFDPNTENDADLWGMVISLYAGYDPYAAAGALSKLAMASNDSGLFAQQFDNINGDVHGSFNNRVARVYLGLQQLCSTPSLVTACAAYKAKYHPHFPGSTPLLRQGLQPQ
jgi:hypothetical protein